MLDKYDFNELCTLEESRLLLRIIKNVPKHINALHSNKARNDCERSLDILHKIMYEYTCSQNEIIVNEAFLLSKYVELWQEIISFWNQCKINHFEGAWVSLQDAIDKVNLLDKHLNNPSQLKLPEIIQYLKNFEPVFPYKVFLSPHYTVKRKRCNICDKEVTDSSCIHIPGRLYYGKVARAIIDIEQLIEMSCVLHPEDKRCVIKTIGEKPLNFDNIRELTSRMDKPLRLFELSGEYTVHEVNAEYPDILCPCGSGMILKDCCLSTGFTREFHFNHIEMTDTMMDYSIDLYYIHRVNL